MEEPQRHRDTEPDDDINKITKRIIGCAIEVHRVLRCGLFESVYRQALAMEFDAAGLSYISEVRVPAVYQGRRLGEYVIDFIVEDRVVVEVKSVERIHPVFETQVLTYLGVAEKRVGLLINFNSPLLKDGVQRFAR
jgi:GxxExxY protein